MASASDAQVSGWQASTRMDHQIAAVIAIWARGKEKGTSLPSNAELERKLDFVPSPSTYRRAKNLLVQAGVLGRGDGSYYVA
jgi:DNA-binding GntR family transcriptional regulator